MRLINADVLKQHIDKLPALPDGNFAGNHSALKALINMQPTVDAVPVVRCKDCKYARMTYDGECKYCDIWFPDEAEYMDGDYYCASGERKDSDHEKAD